MSSPIDWLFVVATVSVLLGYEWISRQPALLKRHGSARARHNRLRAAWVRSVMADSRRDVLGVQTLRNSVMGASLMVTTTALLLLGSLSFGAEADRLAHSWRAVLGLADPSIWLPVRVVVVIGSLAIAFVYFTLAVRLFHHLSYSINVPVGAVDGHSVESVVVYLNEASALYGRGLRVFLAALPFIAWLFDGTLMLVTALAVVVVRISVDRESGVPKVATTTISTSDP